MGNRKGSKRQKRYGFSTNGNKYGRPTRTVLPLSNRINIRLTDMQRDHIEYWSWRMDMTMGDYIRMLIDQDRAVQGNTRRRIKEAWLKKPTRERFVLEEDTTAPETGDREDNKQENTDDNAENGDIS